MAEKSPVAEVNHTPHACRAGHGHVGTLPVTGSANPLRVTISGGGPVGLTLALLLKATLGSAVAVTVFDARWVFRAGHLAWKTEAEGNRRRPQVVTIQSRHFMAFPRWMQERLFPSEHCSEMWPLSRDCVDGRRPINIPIFRLEDHLLALANEAGTGICLVPEKFDAMDPAQLPQTEHVLAICEGSKSESQGTLRHWVTKFGQADKSIYSFQSTHCEDVVLGLKVQSNLSDPMAVLLTVAQNRFLLNAIRGDGLLNMRLTSMEALDFAGMESNTWVEKTALPPDLWHRIEEGLLLFGVPPAQLMGMVMFRLRMVQRPRFTAQLRQAVGGFAGTFGVLLGDAANAVHFWPGRGLNCGMASAISLVNCLKNRWTGQPLRDADFLKHEAAMAMLQYRHKSRAWRFMVTTDRQGNVVPIHELIQSGIDDAARGRTHRVADIQELMERLAHISARLSPRLPGLPTAACLREHLRQLESETLHVLAKSGPWDTLNVGGEEVDVDSLFEPTHGHPQPRD